MIEFEHDIAGLQPGSYTRSGMRGLVISRQTFSFVAAMAVRCARQADCGPLACSRTIIRLGSRHLGQRGAYLYPLPLLAFPDVCDWLWQQAVEVLADQPYQYALTESFALDGLVPLGWLVAVVELADRKSPEPGVGIDLLVGERDLGPLTFAKRAASVLLDVTLGVLLDLIGRTAQLVVADVEHATILPEQRHDVGDGEAAGLSVGGGDRDEVLVRKVAQHAHRPAGFGQEGGYIAALPSRGWWAVQGSNLRHLRCKRSALPLS